MPRKLRGGGRGAGLLAIAVFFSVTLLAFTLSAIRPPKDPAPNFSATSLDGERFTNQSVKGKVVLLQFWATWCQYRRRDQTAVDEISREFADQGLIVLAVNVSESKKTVEKYLERSPRACKVVLTEKNQPRGHVRGQDISAIRVDRS
jgi:thiol-disulfide isomerase/thioredoxin